MGPSCSGCVTPPPKEKEIDNESEPIKRKLEPVPVPPAQVPALEPDNASMIPSQQKCLLTPSPDNPVSTLNCTVASSQLTISEHEASPKNSTKALPEISLQSRPHRKSRFSVELDVQNQLKYFVLDELAEMQVEQEEEKSSQAESQPKPIEPKILTAHRVKRESFVRMSMENINRKYLFEKKVGQGAYGSVFIAKSKKVESEKAIKIISKSKLRNEQENFLSELMILRTLDHPNILKLFQVYDNKSHYYVVTEVCRGGDLLQYAKKRCVSERFVCKVMKQLLSAVNYLHKRSILHRDLKCENILFEEPPTPEGEPVIKIIDFGTSAYYTPGVLLTDKVGSPFYVAPEVLKQKYTEKCDIWSCGVILYVMLCGAPPFQGQSRKEVFDNILGAKLSFKQNTWKKVSSEAKDLIRKMIERDTSKRNCAQECLKHPWMLHNETARKSIRHIESDEVLKNMQNFFFKDRFLAVVKTYVASLLTSQKDKRELAQVFRQLDKDNSGMLETEEILEAYRELYGAITQDFINDIMRKLDTNGSGRIDFTEFIVAADRHNRLMCESTLQSAFNYFDRDNTGYIEIGELRELMGNVEDAEIQGVMQRLDLNRDNRISKEEFIMHILKAQP